MPRYEIVRDGDLVQPKMKGYKMACCDCGLVHLLNFRVVNVRTGKIVSGFKVQFHAFRHNRATAAVRRKPHTHTKKETNP